MKCPLCGGSLEVCLYDPGPTVIEEPPDSELIVKKTHMRYVKLTENEHDKLTKELGSQLDEYIERLDTYIGDLEYRKKGSGVKKYSCHCRTIKNWYKKDRANGIVSTVVEHNYKPLFGLPYCRLRKCPDYLNYREEDREGQEEYCRTLCTARPI